MAKEILLYGTIDAESSSEFIREFDFLAEDNEVVVRVNTPGGSPEYGFGMVAKFAEHKGPKKVKNDGKAFSMGLFFNCYTTDTEALDVTEFILHRAAYAEWVERDKEYFNDAMRSNLERVNKSLRKAFEAKVDVPLFEQLTGCKLNDVFSMESRIDVSFNAAVAKKVGLIKTIIPITPKKTAEINSFLKITASKSYDLAALTADVVEDEDDITQNSNQNKMTLEDLKAKHADVYALAVAEGKKAEKDRVGSIMVFNHLDPEACKKAIESGEYLTETQKSEFALKAMSPEALKKIEDSAPGAVKTAEAESKEKTAAEQKKADFEAEVKAELGLTK